MYLYHGHQLDIDETLNNEFCAKSGYPFSDAIIDGYLLWHFKESSLESLKYACSLSDSELSDIVNSWLTCDVEMRK